MTDRNAAIRRITATMLAWVLLLAAFAPVVTKILSVEQPGFAAWAVCTSDNSSENSIALKGTGAAHHLVGDCFMCHLPTPCLNKITTWGEETLPLGSAIPTLFDQSDRPLFAWTRLPARAPPHASTTFSTT